MSSLRWVVKEEGSIVSVHKYEGEAIKTAMFLNDVNHTDQFYVEKINKREDKNWLRRVNASQVDGV